MDSKEAVEFVKKIQNIVETGETPRLECFTEEERRVLRSAVPLFANDKHREALERNLPLLHSEEASKSFGVMIQMGASVIVLGRAVRIMWSLPGAVFATLLVLAFSDAGWKEVLSWVVSLAK